MKEYHITDIDVSTVESIIFDNNLKLTVDKIDGVSVDSYFIDDYNVPTLINGHRVKPRKHMIALEQYEVCFDDDMEIILTDDTQHYLSFKRDCIKRELHEACSHASAKYVASLQEMLIKCERELSKIA